MTICEREGYLHYIVNPLQPKCAKGTKLRKVKSDAMASGRDVLTWGHPAAPDMGGRISRIVASDAAA